MKKKFLAFIPLSNWLFGFDRYLHQFDKSHVPNPKFPGCFYVVDATHAEDIEVVRQKTIHLMSRLKVDGDRLVCLESELPINEGGAEPNTHTGTGIGWRWPSDTLPVARVGWADADSHHVEWVSHEHITAQAYRLNIPAFHNWEQCQPRSFSVLPIALACNASCAFCFSKASISSSVIPQKLDTDSIHYWAGRAKSEGATRAVITGGGEPTILPYPQLLELTQILGTYFPNVLIINNGSIIEKWMRKDRDEALDKLKALKNAGLTRVALSRHGTHPEMDAQILGLDVKTSEVASLVKESGLHMRYICLLQKQGINSSERIEQYLRRSAAEGVGEVCFKELYVSSLSENPKSPSKENIYCMMNQVPLSLLIETLESLGFEQTAQLPWGSPVYTGVLDGVTMQVAAYTEPSVGWERKQGVVRSWNLTSDGDCLASLEDPMSVLEKV